jgi:phosphoglycolate phosphatase-like HAD superfamily hydrolase
MNSLLSDDYRTIVFDCDGVVLDSNRIKTEAFRSAALPYGEAAAAQLVAYHASNGGISRYVKFTRFLETIVPEYAPSREGPSLDNLLEAYAQRVRAGLMNCAVAEGLDVLRAATPGVRWLIVSGGDQRELREIFAARGLAAYFDGGIFGSPDTKDAILGRELAAGTIRKPALFLGDSRYDFQASRAVGLDFVFVTGWTELPNWSDFVRANNLSYVQSISHLSRKVGDGSAA